MPERIEGPSPEERQLRKEQRLRSLARARRKWSAQRQQARENQSRWKTLTGPLKQPRKEYVDVDTAADLAWTTPKALKGALMRQELPYEQPVLYQKLILKTELREWMARTGRE